MSGAVSWGLGRSASARGVFAVYSPTWWRILLPTHHRALLRSCCACLRTDFLLLHIARRQERSDLPTARKGEAQSAAPEKSGFQSEVSRLCFAVWGFVAALVPRPPVAFCSSIAELRLQRRSSSPLAGRSTGEYSPPLPVPAPRHLYCPSPSRSPPCSSSNNELPAPSCILSM